MASKIFENDSFNRRFVEKLAEYRDRLQQDEVAVWQQISLDLSSEWELNCADLRWQDLSKYFKRSLVFKLTHRKFTDDQGLIDRLQYPYLRKVYVVTIKFYERYQSERDQGRSGNSGEMQENRLFIKYSMDGRYDPDVVAAFRRRSRKGQRIYVNINVADPAYNLPGDVKKLLLQIEQSRKERPHRHIEGNRDERDISPVVLDGKSVVIEDASPREREFSARDLLETESFAVNTQEYDNIIKESLERELSPVPKRRRINSFESHSVEIWLETNEVLNRSSSFVEASVVGGHQEDPLHMSGRNGTERLDLSKNVTVGNSVSERLFTRSGGAEDHPSDNHQVMEALTSQPPTLIMASLPPNCCALTPAADLSLEMVRVKQEPEEEVEDGVVLPSRITRESTVESTTTDNNVTSAGSHCSPQSIGQEASPAVQPQQSAHVKLEPEEKDVKVVETVQHEFISHVPPDFFADALTDSDSESDAINEVAIVSRNVSSSKSVTTDDRSNSTVIEHRQSGSISPGYVDSVREKNLSGIANCQQKSALPPVCDHSSISEEELPNEEVAEVSSITRNVPMPAGEPTMTINNEDSARSQCSPGSINHEACPVGESQQSVRVKLESEEKDVKMVETLVPHEFISRAPPSFFTDDLSGSDSESDAVDQVANVSKNVSISKSVTTDNSSNSTVIENREAGSVSPGQVVDRQTTDAARERTFEGIVNCREKSALPPVCDHSSMNEDELPNEKVLEGSIITQDAVEPTRTTHNEDSTSSQGSPKSIDQGACAIADSDPSVSINLEAEDKNAKVVQPVEQHDFVSYAPPNFFCDVPVSEDETSDDVVVSKPAEELAENQSINRSSSRTSPELVASSVDQENEPSENVGTSKSVEIQCNLPAVHRLATKRRVSVLNTSINGIPLFNNSLESVPLHCIMKKRPRLRTPLVDVDQNVLLSAAAADATDYVTALDGRLLNHDQSVCGSVLLEHSADVESMAGAKDIPDQLSQPATFRASDLEDLYDSIETIEQSPMQRFDVSLHLDIQSQNHHIYMCDLQNSNLLTTNVKNETENRFHATTSNRSNDSSRLLDSFDSDTAQVPAESPPKATSPTTMAPSFLQQMYDCLQPAIESRLRFQGVLRSCWPELFSKTATFADFCELLSLLTVNLFPRLRPVEEHRVMELLPMFIAIARRIAYGTCQQTTTPQQSTVVVDDDTQKTESPGSSQLSDLDGCTDVEEEPLQQVARSQIPEVDPVVVIEISSDESNRNDLPVRREESEEEETVNQEDSIDQEQPEMRKVSLEEQTAKSTIMTKSILKNSLSSQRKRHTFRVTFSRQPVQVREISPAPSIPETDYSSSSDDSSETSDDDDFDGCEYQVEDEEYSDDKTPGPWYETRARRSRRGNDETDLQLVDIVTDWDDEDDEEDVEKGDQEQSPKDSPELLVELPPPPERSNGTMEDIVVRAITPPPQFTNSDKRRFLLENDNALISRIHNELCPPNSPERVSDTLIDIVYTFRGQPPPPIVTATSRKIAIPVKKARRRTKTAMDLATQSYFEAVLKPFAHKKLTTKQKRKLYASSSGTVESSAALQNLKIIVPKLGVDNYPEQLTDVDRAVIERANSADAKGARKTTQEQTEGEGNRQEQPTKAQSVVLQEAAAVELLEPCGSEISSYNLEPVFAGFDEHKDLGRLPDLR